ncbi:MAG: hypothetical protein Kow0042_05820 [Calditrichia bacterium]
MKMKTVLVTLMLLFVFTIPGCSKESTGTNQNQPEPEIPEPPGWELVWSDEFNGTAIDKSNWNHETGGHGWGNNELEYYTDRPANSYIQEGNLVIEAKKENFGGREYTSARMTTKGKRFFKYGRVEARIKLPFGQGIWPAFWMLGESISSVGWPKCGEIDIMEMIGGGENRDDTVHGTAHWYESESAGHQFMGGHRELPDPQIFAGDFHVFAIEWDQTAIKWFLDGQNYYSFDITPPSRSEFHDNFFIILNVAVGGNWPGSPDATTVFPQKMFIDYVRVYRKAAD